VSFTSISEKREAEVIVEILNKYFSEMTKIIYHNKGTLDKYIGDAVMCFFNAPLTQENHSFFACRTAIEQQNRLKELNKVWKQKEYPEIKIRIGIHTGEAIHGNIGSSDTRVNYTVIGDSVNLASRLE
jgi:adenylate cyclase